MPERHSATKSKKKSATEKKPGTMPMVASAAVVLAACGLAYSRTSYTDLHARATNFTIPSQSVFVSPLSFAVTNNTNPRNTSIPFNPTSTPPPFFQIFDPDFLTILGPTPSLHSVASNASFAFAHEAPIWVQETDELFFVSNDGGPLGFSDINTSNKVGKIDLSAVDKALAAQGGKGNINTPVTELDTPVSIQMANGGTGPYHGSLLLATSGRGPLPPSIALVNPNPPYNATILLDNFFGRQFNSLNDLKVLDGKIFVTDTTYGWLNNFRPEPALPSQVYRFDPQTGALRVVADGFVRSNGVAFDKTGKIAYVTDTGVSGGFLGTNQTLPATIYTYDVTPTTHFFTNRRVFAYTDAGVPDGIQIDEDGNVYSGCGDGVQVWNSAGTLLGKFFLGTTSANMVFAGTGRLLIMAETNIFLARIAARGQD